MTWSKGGAFDMGALSEQLDAMLTEQRQPVTARWLCHAHAVSAAEARAALEDYAAKHSGNVAVTYVLTGISKDRGVYHVQLAHSAQLDTVRAALKAPCQQEIYALAPAAASTADPLALTGQTIEQSRELVNAVLKKSDDPKVSAFATNAASAVRCGACRRKEDDRPPARPAADTAATPAVTRKATPASAPAAAAVRGKGAAEAVAGASKQAANPASKAEPAAAEDKPAAPEAAAAAASASKGKKGANALATAFSKAPTRPAKTAKTAPVREQPAPKGKNGAAAQRRASQKVLDDASDDDADMSTSPSPLETRPAGTRRQILADDSDDDFAAPAAPPAPSAAAPAGGALAGTPAELEAAEVPSKRAASAAAESAGNPKQARVTADAPVAPVESNAGAAAGAPGGGKYGAPPDPDAELKTDGNGKAYWSYVNDKGEDVAVPVASKKGQSAAATGGKEVKGPAGGAKVKNETSEAGAKESKPSKGSKGGGKQSKGGASKAGFGDIRNMFGKKG